MNKIFLFLCVVGAALAQDSTSSSGSASSRSSSSSRSSGSSSSSWYSDGGDVQGDNQFVRQGDRGGSVPADCQFKYGDGEDLGYGIDLGFQERKMCPDGDGSYTEYLPERRHQLMEYKPTKYGYEPRITYSEPTSSLNSNPTF